MKRIIQTALMLGFIVLGSSSLQAQDSPNTQRSSRPSKERQVNLQFGYRATDLGNLNQALRASGFPEVANANRWVNVSFDRIYNNRLVLSTGFGGSASPKVQANNVDLRYMQSQFFFRAGYNVLKGNTLRLFPFGGIALSASRISLEDNSNAELTFASQLNQPIRSGTLTQASFGLEAGVGVSYKIGLKSRQMDGYTLNRSLPVGLLVGHHFQVSQEDWKVNNKLLNGPSSNADGFFATVTIGLGSQKSYAAN